MRRLGTDPRGGGRIKGRIHSRRVRTTVTYKLYFKKFMVTFRRSFVWWRFQSECIHRSLYLFISLDLYVCLAVFLHETRSLYNTYTFIESQTMTARREIVNGLR